MPLIAAVMSVLVAVDGKLASSAEAVQVKVIVLMLLLDISA